MNEVLCTIEEALNDLKSGKMLILVDDEDRENEGDLVLAAEMVTPESINFMATHGRGLICLAMASKETERLGLPMMVEDNTSPFQTAFTVSIEAAQGVTTGISAFDRAHTILTAIDPTKGRKDIVTPGHIFPLRARQGGVLVRAGQTEGIVDLSILAGMKPAGVLCEIMKDDGTMARMPDLIEFSKTHSLKIVSINQLIAYRMHHDSLVKEMTRANLPITDIGDFTIHIFENELDHAQHVALTSGVISPDKPTLVRVHSECLTGDTFGSARCDCGGQLNASLKQIGNAGGVLLYMRQEGRGIGLANKLKAYRLQDEGLDTVEANHRLGFKEDHRDYGIGSQILRHLGVREMHLLTNNPRKIYGLEGYGLRITQRVPIEMPLTDSNRSYLTTKREKLGHFLNFLGDTNAEH